MISRNHKPNARQKRWHAWLAERPCCNCNADKPSLHHCAGASAKHNGVWIGQDWVLPLCYDCHQGHQGIHGDRQRFGGGSRKEAEKRLFFELVQDAVLFGLPDVPTPDDRVRELVKARALIAAEIDRLQRLGSNRY